MINIFWVHDNVLMIFIEIGWRIPEQKQNNLIKRKVNMLFFFFYLMNTIDKEYFLREVV